VQPAHDVLARLGEEWHGPVAFVSHGFRSVVLYLALAGVAVAWWLYVRQPALPARIQARLGALSDLLEKKYYADWLAERVIPAVRLIDGGLVNGSARVVAWGAGLVRKLQTGFLYHYAFAMVIGLAILAGWLLLAPGGQ
jgi:NADH-quinone oxidoreductase subunit L